MERKIGETFEHEGKKLKVVEDERNVCFDCYFFDGVYCQKTGRECGSCEQRERADYKPVIFVEAKDEQQQEQAEQQPQELNLCEILKDCPKGEEFWSPLLGNVKLSEVNQLTNAVFVTATNLTTWRINHDATITINGGSSKEIMLYPSREQRDWTKVKYEKKKERFDPKTLKPFDKVLAASMADGRWVCDFFSHIGESIRDSGRLYVGTGFGAYDRMIPYNEETKHLVGTTDEAPEYYRYWEE